MKLEAEVKELLISNAIRLIAEGGFEKATTKELTYCGGHLPDLKMNEVYLYRYFGSKEGLYEAAFLRLDGELYRAFRSGIDAVGGFAPNDRERVYSFFSKAFNFILGNEEKFRCYVRYYYSPYFKGRTQEEHRKLFEEMASEVKATFKEEADTMSILHSVFNAMLDFAVRIYNGDLEDNEENRTHIFNVFYCMMMTYFKDQESSPEN